MIEDWVSVNVKVRCLVLIVLKVLAFVSVLRYNSWKYLRKRQVSWWVCLTLIQPWDSVIGNFLQLLYPLISRLLFLNLDLSWTRVTTRMMCMILLKHTSSPKSALFLLLSDTTMSHFLFLTIYLSTFGMDYSFIHKCIKVHSGAYWITF